MKMKLNVEDLPHVLSGWVIEVIKVDEYGQIAPEDIGKTAPLTLPAWCNPDKQALAVFDTQESAASNRNVVPRRSRNAPPYSTSVDHL